MARLSDVVGDFTTYPTVSAQDLAGVRFAIVGARHVLTRFGDRIVFYIETDDHQTRALFLSPTDIRDRFVRHFDNGGDPIENITLAKSGRAWVFREAQ